MLSPNSLTFIPCLYCQVEVWAYALDELVFPRSCLTTSARHDIGSILHL